MMTARKKKMIIKKCFGSTCLNYDKKRTQSWRQLKKKKRKKEKKRKKRKLKKHKRL